MATENKKMQQRRDTAANWTSNNPTLSAGEIGFETDTGKFKIGDGSTAWNSLADYYVRLPFNRASASGPASLDLAEDTDNGTNYVRVIAPSSIGSNRTATLQDETGTLGFRDLGQNSQSAAYTLVIGDAGKQILHPAADNNARTFTIPANSSVAFPVGTVVTFINEINTVTIAITTDTMVLAGDGATGSRTLAADGIATAVKITSTKWMISGVGLT